MDRKQREIGEQQLFSGCNRDQVEWIAHVADEVDVPAGQVLVRNNTPVREFIVVLDGVAVSDDGTVFGPGAHLDVMGLIDDEPHATTIEALTTMRILAFDVRTFRGLLERAPSVARKLMRELVGVARSAA